MAVPPLFISTSATDAEAVDWLNRVFYHLAIQSVSDLHIQSNEEGWDISIRSSVGTMEQLGFLSKTTGTIVLDRIRSRCNLANAETYKPQDGRFSLSYYKNDEGEVIFESSHFANDEDLLTSSSRLDRRIDVRVAVLPTIDSGAFVVCRVLDQQRSAMPLESLGLDPRYLEALKQVVREPNGLFLVTGPTGSGKTTTLYSLVKELNDGTRNIITVENPVEYVVRGLAQIQVEHQHSSFAEMLRTVLRADPDVILVGEIRDPETAKIAVQAAITGHLVLATLHTNDALSAPLRLLDLGVDQKLLAIALRGVCAQRLLPRVHELEQTRKPTEAEKSWFELHGISSTGSVIPADNTPVHGVFPIIELILVNDEIRKIISSSIDSKDLSHQANQQPWYDTLAQAASFAVLQNKSRIHDAQKIIPSSESGSNNSMRCATRMIHNGEINLTVALKILEIQTIWKFQGVNKTFSEVFNHFKMTFSQKNDLIGIELSEINDPKLIEMYFAQSIDETNGIL